MTIPDFICDYRYPVYPKPGPTTCVHDHNVEHLCKKKQELKSMRWLACEPWYGLAQPFSCAVELHCKLHPSVTIMTATIPRFLLPRGEILPKARIISSSRSKLGVSRSQRVCRYASSSTTSKPKVLEKPAKFNPPSHPSRLTRTRPRQYPGPPLSQPELEAQKTKRYPHMMPPEGTFMHWFLNNRAIHLWISMVRLQFSTDCMLSSAILAWVY